MFGRVFRVLARIEGKLDAVLKAQGVEMSNEQDLQNTLDAEKADLDALAAVVPQLASTLSSQNDTIAALQRRIDELTAGQPVSQLQLDNLTGEANTLKVQSDSIVAALQALVPSPTPVPTPAPTPAPTPTSGTT